VRSTTATDLSIVTLGCLTLFAATACPTIPFGDGPELIAAAACLGVAHPPGYPLYTLLGWLALRLPAGEPAWRMNLLSSLSAALACGAAAWLVDRWTASRAAAVVAGFALAVSSTFWANAVMTEVYALHLLLVFGLLGAATVVGDARDEAIRGRALVVAGAVLGVGIAHHPTIVLALPSAAVLAARGGRGPLERGPTSWLPRGGVRHFVLALSIAIAIPVILYASLMLRARLDPPSNWGRPVTVGALLRHAQAIDYRLLDLGWTGLLRAASWGDLGRAVLAQSSPAALALALACTGIAGWPRPRGGSRARPRVAVALLMGGTAIFGLRYVTTDVEVFFLPLFAALALATGLGVAALRDQRRRSVRVAGLVAGVVVVAASLAVNFRAHDLRAMTAAESYARDILDTVPENGVLFIESADAFGLLYLTLTLGERPDVTIYDRNGKLFRDFHREFPFPRAAGESYLSYRTRAEQAFIDRELTRAGPRAVMFLGWPGYEPPPRYRLEPVGLLYRMRRAEEPMEPADSRWSAYRAAEVAEQALRTGDPVALAIAATYPMARAERAMFDGDRERADALFEEAGRLGSRDSAVQSYIGTIYGRYGDARRAIEWFERAVRVRPSSVGAWNNLALAYELTGDVAGAKRALRRSLDIAPGQSEAAASLARLEAAP
jgi:tetratricopeptide (TPR) repeat protein